MQLVEHRLYSTVSTDCAALHIDFWIQARDTEETNQEHLASQGASYVNANDRDLDLRIFANRIMYLWIGTRKQHCCYYVFLYASHSYGLHVGFL